MAELPRDPVLLWREAYGACLGLGTEAVAMMKYMHSLPLPGKVSDRFFLSEIAWCVYNAGMKEAVIRDKWDTLDGAFEHFEPALVHVYAKDCIEAALRVINHRGKAEAVVQAANKVLEDEPIGRKLETLSDSQALDYLQTYPYIGPITRYHLARNLGFDVVKPDRHLVRLAGALDYGSPDALVTEIAELTGERKGFIDYVLWKWLADRGSKDLEKAGVPSG